jgi:hypothetical protein
MKVEQIKISTALLTGEPIIISHNWYDSLEELRADQYTDENIVELVNRDEATNIGNVARAKVVAMLKDNPSTPRADLEAAAKSAAEGYLTGDKAVRTRGGAASKLGKTIKWATASAEMTKAYTDAIISSGLEAANIAIQELYDAAHPAKVVVKA